MPQKQKFDEPLLLWFCRDPDPIPVGYYPVFQVNKNKKKRKCDGNINQVFKKKM